MQSGNGRAAAGRDIENQSFVPLWHSLVKHTALCLLYNPLSQSIRHLNRTTRFQDTSDNETYLSAWQVTAKQQVPPNSLLSVQPSESTLLTPGSWRLPRVLVQFQGQTSAGCLSFLRSSDAAVLSPSLRSSDQGLICPFAKIKHGRENH